MWEERARRAGRKLDALAGLGLGVSELYDAAIRLVDRDVPSDLTCWAVIDPELLAISTMVSGHVRIPPEYEPRLAEAEYAADEPHTFAALARRGAVATRLSELSAADRARSARLNSVWRPLGVDAEVRLLFRSDRHCWGGAGLVRGGRDYSDAEVEYLTALGPGLAAATRVAVRTETRRSSGGSPAVVVVGPDGGLRTATAGAREWQERFDEIGPQRFLVMLEVMAAGARASVTGTFQARLRDGGGHWALLQASPLLGDADEVAVTIEPASGERLMGLLLAAYGLTLRERDICAEVMAGHSTAEIAGRLFISANTVQDHLKSIFAKVDVRSRGELVARLRPDPEG